METSPNINPIIWREEKVSLNISTQIQRANIALATEKITDHLQSHEPFFSAKSQKVLHIT